ncbi:MAG: hypothetical protein ACFB6R_00665 [Alphaproteobacteria bacterium]
MAKRDFSAANLVNAAFYHQNALNYAAGIDVMDPKLLERIRTGGPPERPGS